MRNKKYLAYINPYFVVSKGGNYTKHIYIGSRRIAYAVSDVDDANVKYVDKYSVLQQTIKDRYADFEVPYNGNYVNCQDYYHSNHLDSTSLITNIEARNNNWNTSYLFNAKELDEKNGLYYYGARYYDSRISLWLGTDPMQEKYPNVSTYAYCVLNPVKLIDPDGCGLIPRAQKMDYTGRSWYNKTGTFLNNVVASIDNIFVDVINGMIDESAFIYNNGVGAYFKEVGKTYSNMGKSIAADFSRPFSEQIQDLGNVLSSPDFYEDFTANMVMLIAAKSVSTSDTGIAQAAKTQLLLQKVQPLRQEILLKKPLYMEIH